ncbi:MULTISPECIES: glycoside hydrolase family protein, partial [unclassified Acinetobacter]
NAKDYAGAADQFPRWNKAGGKVLNGLIRRRDAERALFLKK